MKIHVIVPQEALPLSIQIGLGDEHDSKHLIPLLEDVRVKHGKGRPRSRSKEVTGDSAYDSKEIRRYLRSRGIRADIEVNPRNKHKPKRGRPCRLNEKTYRSMRSVVERFFA